MTYFFTRTRNELKYFSTLLNIDFETSYEYVITIIYFLNQDNNLLNFFPNNDFQTKEKRNYWEKNFMNHFYMLNNNLSHLYEQNIKKVNQDQGIISKTLQEIRGIKKY